MLPHVPSDNDGIKYLKWQEWGWDGAQRSVDDDEHCSLYISHSSVPLVSSIGHQSTSSAHR